MDLTGFVALFGLVFGLVGSVLGVLNYLRDRVVLDVTLQWDMSVAPSSDYDANKKWCVVRVTNIGRRTTYISHAALRLPKGHDASHLVITDSIQGEKLAEGDPTKIYMLEQDGLKKYAPIWRQIRAQVSDSTGKVWESKPQKDGEAPTWAREN